MKGIVDMHCDTLSERKALRQNSLQLDLLRMKESGYLLQNFAAYVDMREHPEGWDWAMRLICHFRQEMQKNEDLIRQVFTFEDIKNNQQSGCMSALLTIEEGGICEGKISRLDELYGMGVRMMTLTWNYPNELGVPAAPPEDIYICDSEGLTLAGQEFVLRMEELGIIPDVSHLSDRGFQDVVKLTKKPFVASHSNVRSLCGHRRNLTEEMIRTLGDRGGVTGLNFYEHFLRNNGSTQDLLEAAVQHARRIVNAGGMGVLGLGSDFDGIPVNESMPGAQAMGKLWDALGKGGFTERERDGIFSENVLRVYQEWM